MSTCFNASTCWPIRMCGRDARGGFGRAMRRLAAAIRPRWLDMTNEMLALATRNAAERNGQNVRFLKEKSRLPLAADVSVRSSAPPGQIRLPYPEPFGAISHEHVHQSPELACGSHRRRPDWPGGRGTPSCAGRNTGRLRSWL